MLRRELFFSFLRILFQIFFKKSKRAPLYFFLRFFFELNCFFYSSNLKSKKMKSYIKFFAFAMVAIVSLSFVSCSDDDADSPYVSDIVGTWKLTEVKTSASGSYISWPFQATYASFNSDGTYYGSGYFGNGSGTWNLKGNTVTTYVDGELFFTYEIISVSGSNAELKMSMDGESIWIKCKKQ